MGKGRPRKETAKPSTSGRAGKSPKLGHRNLAKMAEPGNKSKQKPDGEVSGDSRAQQQCKVAEKGQGKGKKTTAARVKERKSNVGGKEPLSDRSRSTGVTRAHFVEDNNAVELEVEGQATEFRSDLEDNASDAEKSSTAAGDSRNNNATPEASQGDQVQGSSSESASGSSSGSSSTSEEESEETPPPPPVLKQGKRGRSKDRDLSTKEMRKALAALKVLA